MIKGITRQVIVVQGQDPSIFEQAIFLVREEVLEDGGVTEQMLLQQANQVCGQRSKGFRRLNRVAAALIGAGTMGVLWALCTILL